MITSSKIICNFKKKNGERCKAIAMKNSRFCFFHNPNVSVKRAETKKNGGKSKILVVNNNITLKPVKLRNAKQVLGFYSNLISDVINGNIDLRIATGIGYLLNGFIKTYEIAELERKINNIEQQIENNK